MVGRSVSRIHTGERGFDHGCIGAQMNSENTLEKMVQRAQERILGTKFCFACQKARPIDAGKLIRRGNGTVWRCASCANKQSPMGFKKEKK